MSLRGTMPPTDCRTLWIGDIEPWMDESYINQLFAGLASVTNVKLVKDRVAGLPDGKSIGYGFVEFQKHDVAKKVLTTLNGSLIPGTSKTFKLNWASHNATISAQPAITFGKQPSTTPTTTSAPMEFTIYVSDLDQNVNDSLLFAHFKKNYPSTISAKVVTDAITRMSKSYGFVKFTSNEDQQKALVQMNGQCILSKPIKVSSQSFNQSSTDVNTYNYLISQEAHKQVTNANQSTLSDSIYYNIPPPSLPYYQNSINYDANLSQFYKPNNYYAQPMSNGSLRNPKIDQESMNYYSYPPQQNDYQYYQQYGYQYQYQPLPQAPPMPSIRKQQENKVDKRLFTDEEILQMNKEYSKDKEENISMFM